MTSHNLFPLRGFFQNYSWGENSRDSLIGKIWSEDPNLPKNGPVAEMWLGNHPNGKSEIYFENNWITLNDFLNEFKLKNPKFLAKILCIKEVLSIQLHPSKEQAIQLNLENSKNFPDSNSKPEMAIALSPLKLLCGIRDHKEIFELIKNHPAFNCVPKINQKNILNCSIPDLFKLIFNLNEIEISKIAKSILNSDLTSNHDKLAKKIIKSNNKLDAGILALYLLEYHEISIGDAIFIKPQIPHAYIEGTAFECMNNSDNVVRGGLTAKPIDIINFCKLIDCSFYNPVFSGQSKTIENTEYQYLKYENSELPFFLENYETKEIHNLFLNTSNKNEIFVFLNGTGEIKYKNPTTKQDITSLGIKPGSCFFSNSRDSLSISGNNLKFIRVIDLE